MAVFHLPTSLTSFKQWVIFGVGFGQVSEGTVSAGGRHAQGLREIDSRGKLTPWTRMAFPAAWELSRSMSVLWALNLAELTTD